MAVIAWQVPGWQLPVTAQDAPRPGSYAQVWRHPYFRRMSPIGFFGYGGMIAIQTLWAGPWMVRVAGYQPLEAATGLFIINCCMLATFWTWGLVTPALVRRGLTTERLIAWGLPLSFIVLAAVVAYGPAAGAWTLALFCVSCTVLALAQPAVGMEFPPALAGRALSAYNLVIFLGVFVVQWGIGLAIDAFQGAGLSEVAAFRAAFGVFLAACVFAYAYFLAGAKSHNRDRVP